MYPCFNVGLERRCILLNTKFNLKYNNSMDLLTSVARFLAFCTNRSQGVVTEFVLKLPESTHTVHTICACFSRIFELVVQLHLSTEKFNSQFSMLCKCNNVEELLRNYPRILGNLVSFFFICLDFCTCICYISLEYAHQVSE